MLFMLFILYLYITTVENIILEIILKNQLYRYIYGVRCRFLVKQSAVLFEVILLSTRRYFIVYAVYEQYFCFK